MMKTMSVQGTEARKKKVTQNALKFSTDPPLTTQITRYQMNSDEGQVNECSAELVSTRHKCKQSTVACKEKPRFCTGICGTAVTNCASHDFKVTAWVLYVASIPWSRRIASRHLIATPDHIGA